MISPVGDGMYNFVKDLFPICRSITGDGTRQTLQYIAKKIPITIHEIPTGTIVNDWTVPKEWNIRDAYIEDSQGKKIIDFKKNNLHVVGYSTPINAKIKLEELQKHLYSIPEQPDAIPYITSYYNERWGFCLSENERKLLSDDTYHVFIDSTLSNGSLTYGELIIPGSTKQEVFLSTYVCHPSMANNELSGPAVTTSLVEWLMSEKRRYTYRIIFIPETIGSITYLSQNLKKMKKNIIAGFNLTCVGDNRAYSYLPTRQGNTYADKIAIHTLSEMHPEFIRYSYLDRGSDERQYNSPGADLPVCSIMRSKYGAYPEYHTSLDNLNVVSPEGLAGAYEVHKACLTLIEKNYRYKITTIGEPQLGKRGLYPTVSTKSSTDQVRTLMDFIAYADGVNDLIDISKIIHTPVEALYPIIDTLSKTKLLSEKTL